LIRIEVYHKIGGGKRGKMKQCYSQLEILFYLVGVCDDSF
jgi:hypothetical protein